jgi:hypothetical protein
VRREAVDLALAVADAPDGDNVLAHLVRAVGAGTPPDVAAREMPYGRVVGVVAAAGARQAFNVSKDA